MKRLLVIVASALAAVAVYAVAAPAGQQAVTPKQFAALQKRVTTLEKSLKTVRDATNAIGGCLIGQGQAFPLGRFGNGTTEGFLYRRADGQQLLTTALDLVGTAQVTDQTPFLLVTSRACANAINGRVLAAGGTTLRFRPQLGRDG